MVGSLHKTAGRACAAKLPEIRLRRFGRARLCRALLLLPFGKSAVSPLRMGSFSFRSRFDRSALRSIDWGRDGWFWGGWGGELLLGGNWTL